MTNHIASIAFGVFGLAVLISIAFAFSSDKKSVDWTLVTAGIGLQLAFAILVIMVPAVLLFNLTENCVLIAIQVVVAVIASRPLKFQTSEPT